MAIKDFYLPFINNQMPRQALRALKNKKNSPSVT
jgi:hypothetical protein